MKKKLFITLLFLMLFKEISFSQEASGLGVNGITYFSPVKGDKNYYAVYGSANFRDMDDSFSFRIFGGLQFNELVKIIDYGVSLRYYPTTFLYFGVSPYTLRYSLLKESENSVQPLATAKNFGTFHTGLSWAASDNFKLELEGNYNYFYESEAAGYGVSVGLIIYDEQILDAILNLFKKQ